MERLEKENEVLMKVVMELNNQIEKERGNEFKVYEHESIATKTANLPVASENLPPWRIRS